MDLHDSPASKLVYIHVASLAIYFGFLPSHAVVTTFSDFFDRLPLESLPHLDISCFKVK